MNNRWAIYRYQINLNQIILDSRAGVIAGIVAGLFSRMSMRFIALLIGNSDFTISGTVTILFVGTVFILFIPVPLTFGLLLAILQHRFQTKGRQMPKRTLHIAWLGVYTLLVYACFAQMNTLASDLITFPPFITEIYQHWGFNFTSSREINAQFVLFFSLLYTGLILFIVWQGAHHWLSRWTAVVLLIFPIAFFHNGTLVFELSKTFPITPLLLHILQIVSLVSLVVLFVLLPNGNQSPTWVWGLIAIWAVWLFIWLENPFSQTLLDVKNSWFSIFLLVAGIGIGAGIQLRAYYQDKIPARQGIIAGIILTFVSLIVLWLLLQTNWGFYLRGVDPLMPLFNFSLYWLVWLLFPLMLLWTIQYRRLWRDRVYN